MCPRSHNSKSQPASRHRGRTRQGLKDGLLRGQAPPREPEYRVPRAPALGQQDPGTLSCSAILQLHELGQLTSALTFLSCQMGLMRLTRQISLDNNKQEKESLTQSRHP